jgi:hypothetical protein
MAQVLRARRLVGQELSGVVFVRDYIQLQSDDRGLTALTLPAVATLWDFPFLQVLPY